MRYFHTFKATKFILLLTFLVNAYKKYNLIVMALNKTLNLLLFFHDLNLQFLIFNKLRSIKKSNYLNKI